MCFGAGVERWLFWLGSSPDVLLQRRGELMVAMKAFATRLDPRLIKAVKMQAAERGLLVQVAVTQALCQWLKSSSEEPGAGEEEQ
ncbi:hypothetical protein W823_14420 [Williamsia sp. D3]|nr:hypothetical protein W823_14420 [Williamsia sp. D3]PZT97181.1 MAG: hypothetical protein DI630_22245 [Gordonia sp. (in: high G+C Gram-positive bacteria)]